MDVFTREKFEYVTLSTFLKKMYLAVYSGPAAIFLGCILHQFEVNYRLRNGTLRLKVPPGG
jgi:hypothetical protein